jgi:hypothetical protein
MYIALRISSLSLTPYRDSKEVVGSIALGIDGLRVLIASESTIIPQGIMGGAMAIIHNGLALLTNST